MPRKRSETKENSDNYNKAFPTVLRSLMNGQNPKNETVTQEVLAERLKRTRQTVSYYCDGSSSPDWETLVTIADFFDVSMDYLLGRTADPSRSPCAADKLGLTPDNVSYLASPGELIGRPKTVNGFADIVHNMVNDVIEACLKCRLDSEYMIMKNFMDRYEGKTWIKVQGYGYSNPLPNPWDVQNYDEAHGRFVLPAQEGGEYYAHKIGDTIAQYIIDKRVTPCLERVEVMEAADIEEKLNKK